ncbi:MAG: hypothetical protein OER88_12875 [Planctomycetota bacterium]|nr:hypothetical protein [Planctomycetota bacterium]
MNEIKNALREGALNEDERAEVVAEALKRAQRPAPMSWRAPVLAMTAILLVAVAVWMWKNESVADDVFADTAEERIVNETFLASDTGKAALAAVKKDAWVVVHRGKLTSGVEFAPLLKATAKGTHRFVFRKGMEGDRKYDATFVDVPWAGMDFILATGIMDNSMRLRQFPGPDNRPWIPITPRLRVVVSTGSSCPLLVPRGQLSPMFEVPGKASVKAIGAKFGDLRRHLMHVKIDKLGIDAYCEALEIEGIGNRRLRERTWKYYIDVDATKVAAKEKPMVVVLGPCPAWVDKALSECDALLDGQSLGYTPFPLAKPPVTMLAIAPDYRRIMMLDESTLPADVKSFLRKALTPPR